MAEGNNFFLDLIASLQKSKSKQQIKTDVKTLGDIYVKLVGKLDLSKTRQNIKNQLKGLNNNTFTVTPSVNTKGVQDTARQAVNNAQKVADSNSVQLRFDIDRQKLLNQIRILGRNNSKLFNNSEMRAKYNELLDSANIAKSNSELKALRGQLSAFKTELVATNNAGLRWGDKLKASISRYTQLFSGASFIYAIVNQLRNAWTQAEELDKSMTDLSRVNAEITRSGFPDYLDKVIDKTKKLAVATKDYIDAVTTFSRAGYNLADSEILADAAVQLEKVGDMSATDASKALLAGLQGYTEIGGYNMDQLAEKAQALNDRIDLIGNTASITQAEVAQGIQAVGSVMNDANTSIDEFIALLGAGNRAVQDSNKVALAIRTSALRIRGCTAELQEMGEETEDVIESTSTLAEKIKALTNIDGSGGISILEEDEETFRSIYDIYNDIAKVYDKMSDKDASALLDLIAGKNRSNQISAILQNMSEANELLDRSLNAAGTASEEYQIYLDSAEAATERFGVSLTETYNNIINGETVKGLANVGTAVLELENNLGIIKGTIKGLLLLKVGKLLTTLTMAFVSATKSVEKYGKALKLANNIPEGNLGTRFKTLKSIASLTDTLTDAQLKQVLSSKSLTQQDRIRILQLSGMTKEMAVQKLTEMGLIRTTNAQTAANHAQTASTFSLKAAMVGLRNVIKSVFLSNPVGITLMAISIAISAVTSLISSHNQKLEEMRDKAKEAAGEANTLGDEVAELANKYIMLSEAVKTDADAKEDLMTTQTELLKKLGIEGESIDDLIAKYGSLSDAIKQVSIDSLKDSQIDLIAGVDAAREELLKAAKNNLLGTRNMITAAGKGAVKAFRELEKAGIISGDTYGSGGGSLILTGDGKTVEGALENFRILEDAVNVLRDSEAFTGKELSENPLFKAVYNRYNEMKSGVDSYRSAIENLNENLAQQTMLTALQGREIPKTEEEFNTFKQELIDTAVASEQFIGTEEEIADAVNSYLSTLPEFEGYYSEPLEKELKKVNRINFPKSFPTILSQIQSLTEGFEQLDKIYTDIHNKEDFDWSSILNNEKFTEAFGEMGDSYDSFIKTVSNAPDDLEACQSAFDELVTSYIYSAKDADGNSIMKNLTEETKEATIVMLEQMGVANALEVVEHQLRANTEYLTSAKKEQAAVCEALSSNVKTDAEAKYLAKLSTMDLQNATYGEIQSLVDEAEQLGITSSALLTLKLSKMGVNDISIDTSEDINNLLAMANAAGITSKAVGKLAGLEARYKDARDNGRTNEALAIAAEMQKAAEEARNDVLNFKPTVKYEGGSSYKSAVDKVKKDAEKASKEAADTAKDQTDSYMEYMKASLESGRIDYRTYADEVSSYLKNMFDTGKISAKEYHDYVGQMLETQKSILDRVADAVTKRLDKEIDSIKEKMDGIEENYNSQIEYLDTVIEYHEKQKEILQDENDELDRQKALEEALYNLQRAQNQRTIALYTAEKGKIYVADASAVRDAEDDARKAKLDMELARIDEAIEKVEKQQEALKEAMDTEKEQLQIIIDRLEEYKKQWSSVADEYENIQNDMLAKQILGADYESQILDGRLDVLNDFKDEYLSIQKAIMDAAWESAKAQLEASRNTKTSQGTSTSAPSAPSSGTPDTNSDSKDKKTSTDNDKDGDGDKKWYIYDRTTGKRLSGAYSTQSEASKDLNRYAATTASHQVTIKKYASGTKNAKPGLNLVGEEGTETYIDNDGNVSLVTEPSLINMEGGETVIKASETERMLDNAGKLTQSDSMALARSVIGNLNFTMDEWKNRIQAVMPSFADMVQMPEMRAPKDDIMAVNRDNNITVSIGDIHLHEVQNVDGFAKAIIRELPNRVIQNLGKR